MLRVRAYVQRSVTIFSNDSIILTGLVACSYALLLIIMIWCVHYFSSVDFLMILQYNGCKLYCYGVTTCNAVKDINSHSEIQNQCNLLV